MKQKKFFLMTAGALTALAVLFCALVSAGRGRKDGPNQDVVLYLNGDPVSVAEYELLVRENRNMILMQYAAEKANRDDFWETDFDGTYPWGQLAELVLEKLRQNYAIKELAMELGLTKEYDFSDLKTAMDEKNAEFAAGDGGEIQYGLMKYDMNIYYQYWYSSLEASVVTALIREAAEVSAEDCQTYYEAHADEYTYETGIQLMYIELPYDIQERDAAFQKGEELAHLLEETEDQDVIQKTVPGADLVVLNLTSSDRQESLSGVYARRWELASRLEEGEIFGPYEDNGLVCVMKCLDRVENVRIPFSEAESDIRALLERTAARETLDDRARKMEVAEGEISVREVIEKAVKCD